MWATVLCALVTAYRPTGWYGTTVNAPMFPEQHVRVNIYDKTQGTIVLNGFVNMEDEFFFKDDDGEWNVTFGVETLDVLKRYRCRFGRFGFNPVTDSAEVQLRVMAWNFDLRLTKTT